MPKAPPPLPPMVPLDRLLAPSRPGAALADARELPLSLVHPNPWQPRQHVAGIEELAADIAAHGQITPILVRPVAGGQYEIIAGERRWRAMQQAGKAAIAAWIVEMDDAAARAASIRENIHRADLDPEELGRWFLSLVDAGAQQWEIAAAIGKSEMYVSRLVRLAKDPALLAAHQEGILRLQDIGRTSPAVAELEALPAPAEQTEVVDIRPEDRNTVLRTTASTIPPPATFHRQATIYKPFVALQTHVRRLDLAAVPSDERGDLRTQARALIADLEALLAELDSAAPD